MKKLIALLLVICMIIPSVGVLADTVTEYNFTPFKISVNFTTNDSGFKRLVVLTSDFPFTVTDINQLKGCTLSGTVTYSGAKDYSASVPFSDVKIEASTVLSGACTIDFTVPSGYTICSDGTEDSFYTWDLTLNPKPAPQNDIPSVGSTFFVTPDMFNVSGWWQQTTFDNFNILYAAPRLEKADAITNIKIPASGTYNIYSFVRDNATNKPGSRYAEFEVDGKALTRAGLHGNEGYDWEKIGEATFSEGQIVNIKILSTSATYSRVAALMFTTESYVPSGEYIHETLKVGKGTVAKVIDNTKTNLIILPDDFSSDIGTWKVTTDSKRPVIQGQSNKNSPQKDATVKVNIPEDGTYYVWGFAKDYSNSTSGYRALKLAVNGSTLSGIIGIHGAPDAVGTNNAYDWDKAGEITLRKGTAIISAIDFKQYYARLAAVVLTTDPYFSGIDSSLLDSAFQTCRASCVKDLDIAFLNSYGNKLSFTFKNRTDTEIKNGTITAAIYDDENELIDIYVHPIENMAANSSLDATSHTFEASKDWTHGKIMVWGGLDSMIPLRAFEPFTFVEEDYANPDDDADANFGTVTSYMTDYEFVNDEYKGKEYNIRDGIYNTLKKLQSGEDITVAYLGGSITMQESWRPYTTKWLEDNYEGSVTEIDIGLAGTGADLAVCRIDNEVLAHNPDLVFIEYAVNGGAEKDMEGMIHKIRKHDPTTDIMFVYTTRTASYSVYKEGDLPEYPAIFEEVANHYGIPSVFFGYQAFDLYDQGKLTLTGTKEEGKILYTQDGTHLTADGGFLSAGAIARSVIKMEESFNKDNYEEVHYTLPESTLATVPWTEGSSYDDWDKMKFTGTWLDCSVDENNNFKNYSYTGGSGNIFKTLFPKMRGTVVPGSSVTVKFKGTDIGVFEAGGQYSGQLKVNVDGKDLTEKLVLYDPQYSSRLRQQYYFIDSLPYGEHTVTFTLDSEVPDKSWLQLRNPADTIYQKNEFYLGRILLNGELLDINE